MPKFIVDIEARIGEHEQAHRDLSRTLKRSGQSPSAKQDMLQAMADHETKLEALRKEWCDATNREQKC